MLELLAWLIVCFLVFQLATFVYVITHAFIGAFFGIKVELISLGMDFPFGGYIFKWNDWDFQFGLLPIGGFTKFLGAENPEPRNDEIQPESGLVPEGSFLQATILQRGLVLISGPVSQMTFGFLMLLLPVLLGANQLSLTDAENSKISPVAVGGIDKDEQPASLASQLEFAWDVFRNGAAKYFYMQRLNDWGGYIGSFVTCAAACKEDVLDGCGCLGVLCIAIAMANLLPIPILNGGSLVFLAIEAVFGRPLNERTQVTFSYLGLVLVLAVMGRVIYADIMWLISII